MPDPLTILSVAYPFAPVGPDAAGGAEQVLSTLDRAIVAAGHRSVIVACEGSTAAGTLVSTCVPNGTITDDLRRAVHDEHRRNVADAVREHRPDVIHLHGLDFDAYLPPPGPPALVTLHLPPSWYDPIALRPTRPRTHLNCVSHAQRSACDADVPILAVVPNGVDVERLQSPDAPRNGAVVVGRICPEKNQHAALDAGRLAGASVTLAGQVYPYAEHERYFAETIAPRLDDARRFVGPIGFEAKRTLLSSAACLLHPTLAPETSSLVAMEAISCGTPVVAYRSGALPEVVDDGVTGLLVDGVEQMADAIRRAGNFDQDALRRVARKRFSLSAMVGRYFELYRGLAE